MECHALQLLEVVGIGPDTAIALLMTVWDNPQRLGSEASFASLWPTPPSTGGYGTDQAAVDDRILTADVGRVGRPAALPPQDLL